MSEGYRAIITLRSRNSRTNLDLDSQIIQTTKVRLFFDTFESIENLWMQTKRPVDITASQQSFESFIWSFESFHAREPSF